MFSEILNGILMHENKHASSSTEFNPKKPEIKLGVIPAGVCDLFRLEYFLAVVISKPVICLF